MLSFHVKFVQTDRQTDGWTDRRTTVKQYAPGLSIRGHIYHGENAVYGTAYYLVVNIKTLSAKPKILKNLVRTI